MHSYNHKYTMRREESRPGYQLVPAEDDPPCACLKRVCLSVTLQRPDCLVSGQSLSWTGALTALSSKGTGYYSYTQTHTRRVVEKGKGKVEWKKWD